ncbi:helix-turn-helix transcriptional regulator [Bifidobacterium sp.]|uniref:helix-turn-helix transcriptional regulator n=1 Tax=Bifidobacterium sp. TaxID=41200 RepID=UPI003D7D9190
MRLHELRERSGLTLQQLDALTGAAFTRLWTYENRDDEARNMYLGTAAKLAQALHCNVLDLYPDEHVWRGGVSAGVVGLKNIRKARHLTQKDLAGLSGILQPAISRFETNGRPVSQMYLRTALRLSEALQCDPVDFLTEGY